MGAGAGEPAVRATGKDEVAPPRIQAQSAPMIDTSPAWNMKLNGIKVTERENKAMNTKNIGSRLAVDAGCALLAGGTVAPVISMVDK
jgi:hypothetical protein